MRSGLNFRAVDPLFIEQAIRAYEDSDAGSLLISCGGNRDNQLALVADNISALKQRGIYEACLFYEITDAKTNFHHRASRLIQTLFDQVDREKMRAAGDPVPDRVTMTIFRGIAGRRARRPRGFSWPLSLDVTCWFATRFDLADPCVLVTEIKNDDVVAYTNDRHEQEVICHPNKYQKMKLTFAEIEEGVKRHNQATQQSFEDKKAELWSKINKASSPVAIA